MRWPSVYLFAWLYGTIGMLLIFVFIGIPMFAFANGLSEAWRLPAMLTAGAVWLCLGGSMFYFPACPRCGRSPYLRGKGLFGSFSSIPKSRCDRCDLNLRKFGLFDRRAKRGPHV